MSYCRFENTLADLEDCYESLNNDDELSESETCAKNDLIKLCRQIANNHEDQ